MYLSTVWVNGASQEARSTVKSALSCGVAIMGRKQLNDGRRKRNGCAKGLGKVIIVTMRGQLMVQKEGAIYLGGLIF